MKPVSEQVIVITGASSGIGLATAMAAARKGARLVLVARSESALADVQRRIEDIGGTAIHIVADVGIEEEVARIVDKTVEAFGGFDTWVNNAGVGMMGRLDEVSDDDNRRLFDTNYWGIVYGSLAAARHLKGKGGSIINLGSELSDVSIPLQGMYSASKHAVKGFTDALRVELDEEKSNIKVTLVKPAAIATPFFSHAKNYTPFEPKAPPPVYQPEEVAYAILHAAENPVRDIRIGGVGVVMAGLSAHAPNLMDWINTKFMFKAQQSEFPKSRNKSNLHDPATNGSVYGRNMPNAMKSIYTRASLNPAVTGLAVAGIGLAAYALLGRKNPTLTKKLGKAAIAGFNFAMPLQNMATAKNMKKFFEKKSEVAADLMRDNLKSANKAVNENAKLLADRTKDLSDRTRKFFK